MSAGPARAYGLEPPIAVGEPRVLLDPIAWPCRGGFRSRSANSWLLGGFGRAEELGPGETLRGRVQADRRRAAGSRSHAVTETERGIRAG